MSSRRLSSSSRRDFLQQVGSVGGYRATYLTMQAMGLLSTAAMAEKTSSPKEGPGAGFVGVSFVLRFSACAHFAFASYTVDCFCTLVQQRG